MEFIKKLMIPFSVELVGFKNVAHTPCWDCDCKCKCDCDCDWDCKCNCDCYPFI